MRKAFVVLAAALAAIALFAGCELESSSAVRASVQSGVVSYGTEVKLTTTIDGAVVRYTTDGSAPTKNSEKYDRNPISIVRSTDVCAAAFKGSRQVSDVATFSYQYKLSTPKTDITAGTYRYEDSKKVGLSVFGSLGDCSIYYTTDGSQPSATNGQLYSAPITLDRNMTVKAVAIGDDYVDSDVLTASYTVKTAAPTTSLALGYYGISIDATKELTLSCANEGATIYYTLDGTDPRTSETRVLYDGGSIVLQPLISCEPQTIRTYAESDGRDASDVATYKYIVYVRGPAGGIVFYDRGEDATGWRYLEAAPYDCNPGTKYIFGYYREKVLNLYVNGTTDYEEGTSNYYDGLCTGTAIGTGLANTNKLVNKMGTAAYKNATGSDTTSAYAAKICYDYSYGGYDDWFLPSKNELNLMYAHIIETGLSGSTSNHYWSSSEDTGMADGCYALTEYGIFYTRASAKNVRAVRRFLTF